MDSIAMVNRNVAQSLRLLAGAQKSSKGAPPYSLYVNRPLGRVLAALAHRCGLRPNHVTAVSAVFTFAAIAVLAAAPATMINGMVVMVGLCLGYALDSADGQLARLRGGGSVTGEWLDHVIDAAKTSSLHLAVLVALYRQQRLDDWQLLVPIIFAVVAAVHFFGMILNEQLARTKHLEAGIGPVPRSTASPLWMTVAKLPCDYGILCLVFVLFGLPAVFFPVYAFLALANLGYLVLILPKWFRDMSRLDRLNAPRTRSNV